MTSEIPDIAAAKAVFSQWQQTRTHASSRVPKELWDLAVKLCKEHGVTHVSHELGIARSKLYAKLAKMRAANPELAPVAISEPFVTVQLFGASTLDIEMRDCEWFRSDGSRLQIRMPASEVPGTISTFLQGGVS